MLNLDITVGIVFPCTMGLKEVGILILKMSKIKLLFVCDFTKCNF